MITIRHARRMPAMLLFTVCSLFAWHRMADAADRDSLSSVTIAAPASVHNGEPFVCTAHAAGASSFIFEFRGKKVTVPADAPDLTAGGDTRESGLVLLSVPLGHKTGREKLRCTVLGPGAASRTAEVTLAVTPKKYPEQRLTVEQKYVTPDPSLNPRLERESRATRAALGTISPIRYWTLPLYRPVSGIITSEYGLRRIFNGTPSNPHMGLDFRAAEGAPIKCAAAGRVILAGDFYYAGKNVIVDHGLGVLSTYLHLSDIKVAEGQILQRGDLVGLAGSTGRVTGPHLHLSFTVLGSSVTAMPLFEQQSRANAH